MKVLTDNDHAAFWQYFDNKFPEFGNRIKGRSFINQTFVTFLPGKMSEDEKKQFDRIESRWLINNGFREYEPDLIYVFLPDTTQARAIDIADIKSVKAITGDTSELTIKKDDTIESMIINENEQEFKKRVYIF